MNDVTPRHPRGNMADAKHTSTVPGVLARMDRHAQHLRMAVIAAAMVEGLLLAIALLKIDWKNDTQVLLLVFAVLGYTIVGLGLVALGAHVSRTGARIVAALEGRDVT